MRAFHYDNISWVAPSLTKLVQFKNNDFYFSRCPRPKCGKNDLITNSEHIVHECIFTASILYFIKKAFCDEEIDYQLDEMFYLFPYSTQKNYTLSQELFSFFLRKSKSQLSKQLPTKNFQDGLFNTFMFDS